MILVDTSALFAYSVSYDRKYDAAQDWVRQNSEQLLVTDYIIDETLTLIRARNQSALAFRLGELIFSGALATIYYLSQEDILAAWHVFRTYSDKEWSFTDCASKTIIEKLQLTPAFSFDPHFRQFGSVVVVP